MNAKPIYVEIEMKTDLEKLWTHTQQPKLHQQWDLRFSEITYLPRSGEDERQKFLYRTRIGFGLSIAGTGKTKATVDGPNGQRISTLTFGSEQPISLIRQGGGYWKYTRSDAGVETGTNAGARVTFATQYDYKTRFGRVGQLFDRIVFRPLFGYATAWSFDMLRIWLEKGISPGASLQRAFVHYLSVSLLGMLWLYQGLVPKLLFPSGGEMELLQQSGLFPGIEAYLLPVAGVLEIGLALFLCLKHRWKWIYPVQAIVLLVLGMAAVCGSPALLGAPFNPLTLSLAMLGLGQLASYMITDLPNAASCRRKPANRDQAVDANQELGGKSYAVYL